MHGCTTARRIPAVRLEGKVVDEVLKALAKDDLWLGARARYLAMQRDSEPNLTGQLAAVRTDMASARRTIDRYRSDYEAERIDAGQWGAGIALHRPRLLQLEATERSLVERLDEPSVALPSVDGREEVLATLRKALEKDSALALRRKVIRGIVESIVTHDGEEFLLMVAAPTRATAQRLLNDLRLQAS